MNRTHGSVTTMWILGSGLLLSAGQTMDAQEVSPSASEYYAPHVIPAPVVPAQQTAAVFSESLGKPAKNATRPLAASVNPSLPTGRNVAADKVFPNTQSVQTASHKEPATLSVSQNVGTPSSVQQQLEELYRRDGKQMPSMTLQQAPNTQTATPAANAGPAQGQIQRPMINGTPPAQSGTPYAVPPKTTNSATGFLNKLNPFKSKPAPAPLPQHPAQPMPNGMIRRPTNGQPIVPNQSQFKQPQFNQPQVNNQPRNQSQLNHAGRPQQTAVNPTAVVPVTTPTPQVPTVNPAVSPAPQSPTAQSQLAPTLPPVPGDADYVAPAASSDSTVPVKTEPLSSIDEVLENAFSEMPEETLARQPETSAPVDDDPFRGTSLDETPAVSPAAKSDEPQKPEQVPSPKLAEEPKSDAGLNIIPFPAEIIPLPLDPDPAPPKGNPAPNDVNAKVKLIKERGELRGLKGFCAVALRDTRDLKNALPEHTSTHKGRTYYFSSAAAKVAFDRNPGLYAPISGGNDVVLLKHKITKEGSLDYAVWFKDRLYLFTSQKTLEQFVAAPQEFVISE